MKKRFEAQFELPSDEMAFRRIYRLPLQEEQVTVVFRPGKRLPGDYRAYHIGQIVQAKIIDQAGLDRAHVAPEFLPYPIKHIRIESIEARKIGSLEPKDFIGSTADVYDKATLVYQLGLIYNMDPADLTDDAIITRVRFSYLDMKIEIPKQYVGLITIAKLPKNNPQNFDFEHYDLTPVDHDYAGQFQIKANYVFRKLGMNIGFLMVIGDPKNTDKIYEAFRRDPKYSGGGTGSGFKNIAPKFLDKLDPLAEQIGAINVVAKANGQLIGYNTDGIGFVRGLEIFLRETFDPNLLSTNVFSKLNVLILGAGGTADAIAFTLASCGAKLVILNRTEEKAKHLANRVNSSYPNAAIYGGEDLIAVKSVGADVIINASTKGAEGVFKDFSAFAPAVDGKLQDNLEQSSNVIKILPKRTVVCDVNLRSDESPTLRQAREVGLHIQDGRAMNLYQAVEALWIMHHNVFKAIGVTKEEMAKLVAEAK
jgi:shikimate dehydrogenase